MDFLLLSGMKNYIPIKLKKCSRPRFVEVASIDFTVAHTSGNFAATSNIAQMDRLPECVVSKGRIFFVVVITGWRIFSQSCAFRSKSLLMNVFSCIHLLWFGGFFRRLLPSFYITHSIASGPFWDPSKQGPINK